MNPMDAELANTLAAHADFVGVGAASWGQMLLSLLLVVGLVVLFAWLLKRFGMARGGAPAANPEGKILYYSRFNREQTLVLMEMQKELYVLVLRGKTVECSAPLPGVAVAPPREGRRPTFQEVIRSLGGSPKGGGR